MSVHYYVNAETVRGGKIGQPSGQAQMATKGNLRKVITTSERLVWIAIEGLPMCAWNNKALSKIVSPWGTLTPVDLVEDSSLPYKKVCVTTKEPPQDKISEDPFGIYNILNKQDNKEAGQDSDPSHPPGFTQEVNVGVSVNLACAF
ncbi:hypothetical protein Tco_1042116 [Tanacetum coccineum]|uniref:DUF4283 domain-containing protein n=1 Tax=Tanacetum coccineum TaxID=301880 RepID=A0ABQ5GI42_9ASTR